MSQHFGYATLTDATGTKERDTFTCAHCNKIVHIPPRGLNGTRPHMPGGGCRICNGLICDACCDLGSCTPWEKKLEKMESRDRFLRQAGDRRE